MTKNLALAVSITAVGTGVLVAQPTSAPPAAAASTNAVGPKIQFATPMYDFGRVKAGEPVKYTYIFTNTGDRLLIINSVQPQCGCTPVGDWTKQVEPGNTGSITIQFNTANYNSPVFKQVTVTCNVTNQPMLFLQLKGTVFKPYDVIPPVAVLNVSPDSEAASIAVTITNNTEEPLMLSAPECNNRMFAAQLKTNAPGKGYQLTISTVPPLAMGYVQGLITMQTGSTNPPTISVTAVANVKPAVMVVPSYITLAPGPLGGAVTNSVSIRNESTNEVRLSDPVVNAPGVQAEIKEMQPGKSFTAMVAFPQGFQVPPGQPVELSFKTSHPKFPLIKVPIMQLPRPAALPPPVQAAPTALAPPAVTQTPPSLARPLPPRPPPPPLPPGR